MTRRLTRAARTADARRRAHGAGTRRRAARDARRGRGGDRGRGGAHARRDDGGSPPRHRPRDRVRATPPALRRHPVSQRLSHRRLSGHERRPGGRDRVRRDTPENWYGVARR